MENNNIYDLISLLNKPQGLNTDIFKAVSSVRDSVENTYVKKIYQTAENEIENTKKNPSREVTLLKALKNFANAQTCQNIDNAINLINTINIINRVNQSALSCQPTINIKSDEEPTSNSYQSIAAVTDVLMLLAIMKKL